MSALNTQLEEDPELAAEVEEFITQRKKERGEIDRYMDVAASEPKFVFESDDSDRPLESIVTVKNRFGDIRGGQIKRRITAVAYLVLIDDQLIVAHEPSEAW